MEKPSNYDNVEGKEIGEYEVLAPGGHICKILKAVEGTTKTGKKALYLYLDIALGDQKDFFKKRYDTDTRQEKKWGCIYTQVTEGESTQYFKGVITAIEKSNPNFTFNFDEKTLAGKIVGGVFGREQYKNQNGELKFITKCFNLRSKEAIEKGVPVPEDRLYVNTGVNEELFTTVANVNEEELPF